MRTAQDARGRAASARSRDRRVDDHGTRTACSYCGVGCGIEVTPRPTPAVARHRQGVRRQAAPGQLRPAVHQGRDPRRDDGRRRRAADIGAAAAVAWRGTGARTGRRRRRRGRQAAARHRRRTRPRRRRAVCVRPDVHRGAVSGQQAGQGLPADGAHRVELAAVHGQRGHRVQAVARRRRAARVLHRLRLRRPVFRHRRPTWPTAIRSCSCGWPTG